MDRSEMNRDDFPVSSDPSDRERQRQLVLSALASQARYIQTQRDQQARFQTMPPQPSLGSSSSSSSLIDSLLGRTTSSFARLGAVYNINNTATTPRDDLQELALRLSSTTTPTRAAQPPADSNPLIAGRQKSFLPFGPAYLGTYLTPNEAVAQLTSQHPSIATMPTARTTSASSSSSLPMKKRKRDSTLEPSNDPLLLDSKPRAKTGNVKNQYDDEPPSKKQCHESYRGGSSSFPLPQVTSATPKTQSADGVAIPLTSYRALWEEKRQRGDFFRKRIQRDQVPIQNDTSITGRYTKVPKRR